MTKPNEEALVLYKQWWKLQATHNQASNWLLEQLREIPDRCVCTKQAYLFLHICFPITVLVLHQSKAIQLKYLQAQTIHQVLVELVTSAKDDESDWAENSSRTSTNRVQNFKLVLWVVTSISRYTR